jgi:hypothetical protein
VATAAPSGRNVFSTETKEIVIVTTLTSVKYWKVMSHSDHVGSAWSSLALIVAVLDAIHAITREVTQRRQLLGLNTVAVSMRRLSIRIVVRDSARALKSMNLSAKLSILHAHTLSFMTRDVEIGLQAVNLRLEAGNDALLIINEILLAVMLSDC